MKTKTLFLLPALSAGLGLILAGRVTAQTFTTLHSFTEISGPLSTNSDGTHPLAGLILSGNTLYGTVESGGSSGKGTVFKVNTDGTGFTVLHNFTLTTSSRNSDGCYPLAGLILSGSTLYGTANQGGSLGSGTVFRVNTNGTDFTNLHSFTGGSDGWDPHGDLVLSGNTLYGTASFGGSSGNGTVFAINTDGTDFTTLHSFTTTSGSSYSPTNSDGADPRGGLIVSGNTLYGTARYGGSSGNGTVFAINTDGTGFTNLHSFTGGSDGSYPRGGLVLSGNTLYGTASFGGSSGNGTVFAINTDGTDFTALHSFTTTSGSSYPPTNIDGADPRGGLIVSGNTLYGTARYGGSSGNGTVFAVNTDGGGFTNLHSFTETLDAYSNSDGRNPFAGLILAGNALYGTAAGGGGYGRGTVFSLSFTPQLTVIPSGANLVLTWPTNVAGFDYSGFTLQSTTNLVSTALWTTVSPGPVVLNGQNAVTNLISGTQQFFRLSQ